jgi:hypothetical protein
MVEIVDVVDVVEEEVVGMIVEVVEDEVGGAIVEFDEDEVVGTITGTRVVVVIPRTPGWPCVPKPLVRTAAPPIAPTR